MLLCIQYRASLVAQRVKRLPAIQETRVRFLGGEDPVEKEIATHSSTLAWKIPWMEKPGRLQSMESQRVGHDWATSLSLHSVWGMVMKWDIASHMKIHILCFYLCLRPFSLVFRAILIPPFWPAWKQKERRTTYIIRENSKKERTVYRVSGHKEFK